MLFPTPEFLIFFVFVFVFAWSLYKIDGARKIFLLLASYFFYGFWDWRFVVLLFGSTLINYLLGLLLGAAKKKGYGKSAVALSIFFNLGLLVFFKYYNFFSVNANNLFIAFGFDVTVPFLEIILPVGISFFTFHAISYTLDLYRDKIEPVKSLSDLSFYFAFFPHLVAGPIVRAGYFLPQLKKQPDFRAIKAEKAVSLILSGLFKKVVIANYIAVLLVDPVFANPKLYSSLEVLLAAYGYAVQIFCDFSAYTDIAIGIAALLGYDFPDNFNRPYSAASIKDFWRRWHISLSSWLRDYLYIALGGSKKGKFRTYLNLFFTMLLGGLWHGAAWNFVLWGAFHGLGLAVERLFSSNKSQDSSKKKPVLLTILCVFLTFHFVTAGWILFRASSFSVIIDYFQSFANFNTSATLISPAVICLLAVGLAMHFTPQGFKKAFRNSFGALPIPVQGALVGIFIACIVAMFPEGMAPFIYFQF